VPNDAAAAGRSRGGDAAGGGGTAAAAASSVKTPYGKNLLDIQVFWPRDPGKSRIRWP